MFVFVHKENLKWFTGVGIWYYESRRRKPFHWPPFKFLKSYTSKNITNFLKSKVKM